VDKVKLRLQTGVLQIEQGLGLSPNYFANTCAMSGNSCNALMNAVFADGFAGQEPNQGSDPLDWRSSAIANPDTSAPCIQTV